MDFKRKLLLFIICCTSLQSFAHVPNHDDETPLLGPTLRLSHTAFINDEMAYSLAGELGIRNIRVSGTFGYEFGPCQRAKLTAEILSQRLSFEFTSGTDEEWISQGAIGADYQQDLGYFHQSQVDLNAYFSYANSKSMHNISGFFVNNRNVMQAFLNQRHIAGSYAFGINPGYTITPWIGTVAGLQLNYDKVNYNVKYDGRELISGFGGTFHLNQLLADNIAASTIISYRKPFNYYYVDVMWINMSYMGRWNVGFYGEYVDGKHDLPNSWNAGLRADYLLDPTIEAHPTLKDEVTVPTRPIDPFVTWVSDPAVRMPQVLAIADEQFTAT